MSCAQADYGVRSLDRKPWCSVCKVETHYTRSCHKRYYGPMLREDDALVQYFLTTKEEEPEEQKDLLKSLWD